jgi:hypothetical protein
MIIRDTDDDMCGRVAPFSTCGQHAAKRRIKTRTPRGRLMNTIACERIALLRADELFNAGDTNGALPWLRYASEHRTRNLVMRSATVRR